MNLSKNLFASLKFSPYVTLFKKHSILVVVGPLGTQLLRIPVKVRLSLQNDIIVVSTSCVNSALFFSFITLWQQYCRGVEFGFLEVVNVVGLGWRVSFRNQVLSFKLGFSHEIRHRVPSCIEVCCIGKQQLSLFGLNLVEVSQLATNLTRLSSIDVYKGKGLFRAFRPKPALKSTK